MGTVGLSLGEGGAFESDGAWSEQILSGSGGVEFVGRDRLEVQLVLGSCVDYFEGNSAGLLGYERLKFLPCLFILWLGVRRSSFLNNSLLFKLAFSCGLLSFIN